MSRSLGDAWSRFGTDVLGRLPFGNEARRLIDAGRAPYRAMGEMHEAWLDSVGGVPKSKYIALLEESLELRRRLETFERARGGPPPTTPEGIDDAFRQVREAQEQWLSMWMPRTGASSREPSEATISSPKAR